MTKWGHGSRGGAGRSKRVIPQGQPTSQDSWAQIQAWWGLRISASLRGQPLFLTVAFKLQLPLHSPPCLSSTLFPPSRPRSSQLRTPAPAIPPLFASFKPSLGQGHLSLCLLFLQRVPASPPTKPRAWGGQEEPCLTHPSQSPLLCLVLGSDRLRTASPPLREAF